MAGGLYWYQHLGRSDAGSVQGKMWRDPTPTSVGLRITNEDQPPKQIDWNQYAHVFAAEDGVIYAIG